MYEHRPRRRRRHAMVDHARAAQLRPRAPPRHSVAVLATITREARGQRIGIRFTALRAPPLPLEKSGVDFSPRRSEYPFRARCGNLKIRRNRSTIPVGNGLHWLRRSPVDESDEAICEAAPHQYIRDGTRLHALRLSGGAWRPSILGLPPVLRPRCCSQLHAPLLGRADRARVGTRAQPCQPILVQHDGRACADLVCRQFTAIDQLVDRRAADDPLAAS